MRESARILFQACALLAVACGIASAQSPTTVYSELQRMRSTDHLYRPQSHECVQYSGFDRGGGNPDRFDCLYEEASWRVVADHEGPGVVTRIWTTHGPKWGDIQIEVDGQVLYSGLAKQFFVQDSYPFKAPLAEVRSRTSTGTTAENEGEGKKEWGISYVPIPFEKRVRYLQRDKVYANINIKSLASDASLESFVKADSARLEQECTETARVWNSMNLLEDFPTELQEVREQVELPGSTDAEMTQEVVVIQGPGVIRSIRVKPSEPSRAGEIWLELRWDDEATPAVAVPLDVGFGSYQQRTIALGQSKDGWRFCNLPMPFGERATISLKSKGAAKSACDVDVQWEPLANLPDDVLYLRSHVNSGSFEKGGEFAKPDLPLATFFFHNGYTAFDQRGTGHLVAYMDLFACQPELDEHVFIDGEREFPHNRWNGTGHEDLFDMAWGHSPVSSPMTSGGSEDFEEVNVKLFWNNPMTFRESIRFNWEWVYRFGVPAPRDARFMSVVYWYGNCK